MNEDVPHAALSDSWVPEANRSLDQANFAFFGFDGLMDPLTAAVRELGIRHGYPALTIVENAVYIPAVRLPAPNRTPGRFVHEGGLVTQTGEPIAAAQSLRRATRWGTRVLGRVAPETFTPPAVHLDEDVVYLGWYFAPYGHFLAESLARTWFLKEVDPQTRVLFHTMRGATPEGINRHILEEFGIPRERILLLDQPTLLRRVMIPEQLYELSSSAHAMMPVPFREVASRIAGASRPSEQPVYLSRRLLPSHLRQIVGEFELEEILRENGVRIAYPETMSFADQLRLVNQHAHIFTNAGSAAYNVLFALHQPTVHFLTAGIPRQDYFLLPAVAGTPAVYSNCLSDGDRPSITTSPLLAEIPKFVTYLESQGMLRKRLRASLAEHTDLKPRFDEAWLYAAVQDLRPGQRLDPEIEREALLAARTSWPLSMILAHYASAREPIRVDPLARKFAELAAAEAAMGRLALYARDVASMAAPVIKQCSPDTALMVKNLLRAQFQLDPRPSGRRRGMKSPGNAAPDWPERPPEPTV